MKHTKITRLGIIFIIVEGKNLVEALMPILDQCIYFDIPSLPCINVIRFSLLNHLPFSNGLKGSLEVIFSHLTPAVSITCGTPPPSNYIYLLLVDSCHFVDTERMTLGRQMWLTFPWKDPEFSSSETNWFKRQSHVRMCANHFTNGVSHSQNPTAWLPKL